MPRFRIDHNLVRVPGRTCLILYLDFFITIILTWESWLITPETKNTDAMLSPSSSPTKTWVTKTNKRSPEILKDSANKADWSPRNFEGDTPLILVTSRMDHTKESRNNWWIRQIYSVFFSETSTEHNKNYVDISQSVTAGLLETELVPSFSDAWYQAPNRTIFCPCLICLCWRRLCMTEHAEGGSRKKDSVPSRLPCRHVLCRFTGVIKQISWNK